jgi:PEP-CTERM motif
MNGKLLADHGCAELVQRPIKSFLGGNMKSRSSLIFRITFLAVLAAAAVLMPSVAHADSYIDYTVSGTFDSGGTLSGTFTIDTTTNTISAADLTADGVEFTCPNSSGPSNGCTYYTDLDHLTNQAGFLAGDSADTLFIDWSPNADPSGFSLDTYVTDGNGGYVTYGTFCEGCVSANSYDFLESGTATDPPNGDGSTSTPEPSTWLLLLAGLAGMGFLGLRRRGVETNVAF